MSSFTPLQLRRKPCTRMREDDLTMHTLPNKVQEGGFERRNCAFELDTAPTIRGGLGDVGLLLVGDKNVHQKNKARKPARSPDA